MFRLCYSETFVSWIYMRQNLTKILDDIIKYKTIIQTIKIVINT